MPKKPLVDPQNAGQAAGAEDLAAALAEKERALVPQFKPVAKPAHFMKRESRKPIPIPNLKQAPRRTGKRG